MKKACNITISGLVQGVGFRPFVYRLAKKHHLNGWVKNCNDCVEISVAGMKKEIDDFVFDLQNSPPGVSKIKSIDLHDKTFETFSDFQIITSKNKSNGVTEVSADLAVCDDCLEDMKVQRNRMDYPFINCTNCGPRFSIVKALPYDRPNTTMHKFTMCSDCTDEYLDVNDRRFHAQPIACNECGPHYAFYRGKKLKIKGDDKKVIEETAAIINDGGIAVIKGIGGYFIACDAFDEGAVIRLRENKKKYAKPFAVMARDIDSIRGFARVSADEEKLLASKQRPILLLKQKKKVFHGINDGLASIGVMLPYMPFHYLMFEKLSTDVLVFTSGNISEEPIVINDKVVVKSLGDRFDAVVTYNREIQNRVDDSVVMIVSKKQNLLRRSRGYAPEPVGIGLDCEGVFATGAELANCFAIGKGDNAIISQYIGDLKNYDTFSFFEESYDRFCQLFRFQPTLVACDLHPDYLSTGFAEKFDLPLVKMQHHHAHFASCLVENHHKGEAIGVCFDGTGYGLDGNIWGGEFLVGDLLDFERPVHFEYVPVCGGDSAAHHPWRSALSYLHFYGVDKTSILNQFPQLDNSKLKIAINSLESEINCPLSSSAGRLFDAVASLLDLCHHAGYHSQAPMLLEAIVLKRYDEAYHFELFDDNVSFRDTITDLLDDLRGGMSIRQVATKFHNTIVDVVVQVSLMLREERNINTVALSGGTFQNRYLLEHCMDELRKHRFNVLTNHLVPSNDGGIALGQIAIAAAKRNQSCV